MASVRIGGADFDTKWFTLKENRVTLGPNQSRKVSEFGDYLCRRVYPATHHLLPTAMTAGEIDWFIEELQRNYRTAKAAKQQLVFFVVHHAPTGRSKILTASVPFKRGDLPSVTQNGSTLHSRFDGIVAAHTDDQPGWQGAFTLLSDPRGGDPMKVIADIKRLLQTYHAV